MNLEAKKKVLRSFTYGLYVLTAQDGDEVAAGTVNWVTQASFQPPLVVVGLKRDSHLHALVERTGKLALMTLAHDQKAIAQDFFKPTVREGDRLNGHPFEPSPTFGLPLLTELPYGWRPRCATSTRAGTTAWWWPRWWRRGYAGRRSPWSCGTRAGSTGAEATAIPFAAAGA